MNQTNYFFANISNYSRRFFDFVYWAFLLYCNLSRGFNKRLKRGKLFTQTTFDTFHKKPVLSKNGFRISKQKTFYGLETDARVHFHVFKFDDVIAHNDKPLHYVS